MSGRRQYGTGSICFDASVNKLIARIRIHGKTIKKSFPKNKKRLAEKWLEEMAASSSNPDDSKLKLIDYMHQYINTYRKPFVRERTLKRIKQAVNKLEDIHSVPLSSLDKNSVQQCINKMIEENASVSTIKKSAEILKSALQQAMDDGILLKNPASSVRIPKMQKRKSVDIFSRKEIGKIFHALRQLQHNKMNNSQRYDYILLFRLLLYTGIRISELIALKWENVDFQHNTIEISGSKDIDKQVINAPKTDAGNRTIPLLSLKTVSMLKMYQKNNGFVFSNKNGNMITYQRIYLTWNNVRKITGITKSIHTFRHTCISYLLTKYPIADVSAFAGHQSSSITLSVYNHSIQKINAEFRTPSRTNLPEKHHKNS